MAHKWMEQDSNEWTTYTMKQFILIQNRYSYDGGRAIKHSANVLADFADIDGEQRLKFLRVYNNIYKRGGLI